MRHTEHDLQIAIAQYLEYALPREAWFTSIDHANARDRLTGALRKARGVKPGIPDIIVVWQGRLIGFELKTRHSAPSPAQLACHVAIRRAGSEVHVIRNSFEIEAHLRELGIPLRARHLPLTPQTNGKAA